MIKLAVSPGDPAGIGPDICIKAFGLNKDLDFSPVVFGDINLFKERAQNLEVDIKIQEYKGQTKIGRAHVRIVPSLLDPKLKPGEPNPNYGGNSIKLLEHSKK